MGLQHNKQQGFTLIEVMVAMVLGLFVIAGLVGIFVSTSRGYREDQKTATLHDELGLAMAQITEDVEMAGFWSPLLDNGQINVDSAGGRAYFTWSTGTVVAGTTSLTVGGTSCGPQPPLATGQPGPNNNTWTYDNLAPVYIEDNITSAVPANFPCITDAVVGTDVIGIKRVIGRPVRCVDGAGAQVNCDTGVALVGEPRTAGRVYLRSNGTTGAFYGFSATTADPPSQLFNPTNTYQEWEYRISIYYIRNFAVTSGDGIPALCRRFLQGGSPPDTNVECFAQGIENLQVEVGVDNAPATRDGIPDLWQGAPTTAQLDEGVAVRLWLLGRSVDLATQTGAADTMLGANASYSNAKTYTLAGGSGAASGATVVANDNFYRRVGMGSVLLRNPANLRNIK